MKPVIAIENALLRPVASGNAETYLGLMRRPDVMRGTCSDRILFEEEVEAMLADSGALDHIGFGLWVIEDSKHGLRSLAGLNTATERLQGTVGMQCGIRLGPCYRGKRVARRTLTAPIRDANTELSLETLVAVVDGSNAASLHLLETGGLRGTDRGPDITHDLVICKKALSEPRTGQVKA